MRPARRARRIAPLLAPLLLLAGAAWSAEGTIDHHLASPGLETLLAPPPLGPQALVTPDGGLRLADGAALSIEPTEPFAFARKDRPVQRRAQGRLPVVTTVREGQALAMETTAFAAASPPGACLRVVVRNRQDKPLAPVLRLTAEKAHGTLPKPLVGFQREGQLVALCELRQGTGEVVGAGRPARNVFRREGGRPLPGWASPKMPCDPAFRNIVAGFSEPATYHLQVQKGQRYLVAVGLCESHWKVAGKRICDLLIEGQKVATVDPVAKPHGPDVPFVLTFPATDRDGDGWISVTSVANPASPDVNSIVNVLWLFTEEVGKELSPADIRSGKTSRRAHCYVDCGGRVDAPGPATLDVRVDLPANGSATLWVQMPLQAMPATDAGRKLAGRDPAKLQAATEEAWRRTLARAATVRLGEPAAEDLLYASVSTLLALRCGQDGRVGLGPGPFAAAPSPTASALGALALDRMGLHAEAAAVLEDLAARQRDDHLWHDGPDPWTPTGHALWALVAHYELTGDAAWLEAHYRPILRAAEALILACDHTRWAAHRHQWQPHGLVPPTPHGTLPADYWLVHDFWAMAALRAAAAAARALDKPNDYKWLEDDLRAYREVLRPTLEASRVHGPAAGCLPAAPGETSQWTFAPCVVALYPAAALPRDHKLVAATFAHLDRHAVEHLPGGLDGQGPVVDVPLACHYALARLARGDGAAALAAFTSLANLASPTGTLPQQARPAARRASGPAPSTAATAAWTLLLREMLVRETDGELHLLPCVPRAWLAKELVVENLPTAFGPLALRARLDEGRLVVEPRLKARQPPHSLVLHPPLPRGRVQPRRLDRWTGQGRLELKLEN